MRIVHELNQLDFGGVEKVIRNIVAYDKKNEHTILAYKDGMFRPNLEKVGAKIVLTSDKPEDSIDVEADIIHIHSGGGVSELANSLGKIFPVIETIHSPIRSPMKQDVVFQRVGVCDYVSSLNMEAITIKNGIDFSDMETEKTSLAVKEELGIDPGIPVIGRLGRIGIDKGLEEWLLTCYYLQKAGLKFTPLIVGDEARGCVGYRGKLKLMAESLPVKGIVWIGQKEDVSHYLKIMDIFLYPSLTEGFGLVFAEAIYNECVVVAYETPVTMELFGGYSILVHPNKGIPGLVRATESTLKDQSLRDEFIGIGREFILSEYQAERMSLDYQELYEHCYENFNGKIKSQTADVVSA
jgi:glycosyltransferase involved in cell wall biosynthesis